MNAILTLDSIDSTEDCKIHESAFITFGGKWMMCPYCAAAELAALTARLETAERERDTMRKALQKLEYKYKELSGVYNRSDSVAVDVLYEDFADELAAALKAGEA